MPVLLCCILIKKSSVQRLKRLAPEYHIYLPILGPVSVGTFTYQIQLELSIEM